MSKIDEHIFRWPFSYGRRGIVGGVIQYYRAPRYRRRLMRVNLVTCSFSDCASSPSAASSVRSYITPQWGYERHVMRSYVYWLLALVLMELLTSTTITTAFSLRQQPASDVSRFSRPTEGKSCEIAAKYSAKKRARKLSHIENPKKTKIITITRNTFCGTWYLPHSRVHRSMTKLCA